MDNSAMLGDVSRKYPKLNDSRQQDREASLFFDGDSSLRIHQLCKFIDCCHHGKTPRQCFDLFAFTSETSWMKKQDEARNPKAAFFPRTKMSLERKTKVAVETQVF